MARAAPGETGSHWRSSQLRVGLASLRTQSARHRVDHGTICVRSCANSGHYKRLCACADRTFVNPNSSRRRPEENSRSCAGVRFSIPRAPTRNSDVSQGQHALNPSSHGMTPEPNPAQEIVASKIAGGVTASLPFYRPHSEEKASAARKRPTKRLRAATKGGRGEK